MGKSLENFFEGMACNGGCLNGALCIHHGPKNVVEVDKFGLKAKEQDIKNSIDLYNLNKYKDIYDNFSLDYNIYVVSVNPIERHKSITNKDIEEFNSVLKSVNKSIYIDTYKYLKTKGF